MSLLQLFGAHIRNICQKCHKKQIGGTFWSIFRECVATISSLHTHKKMHFENVVFLFLDGVNIQQTTAVFFIIKNKASFTSLNLCYIFSNSYRANINVRFIQPKTSSNACFGIVVLVEVQIVTMEVIKIGND